MEEVSVPPEGDSSSRPPLELIETRETGAHLINYLCGVYQVPPHELVKLNPMAAVGYEGYTRCRERVIPIQCAFEFSAISADNDARHGRKIRMSVGEMIDGKLGRLLPRKNDTKDSAQGLRPRDFDYSSALVNSIVIGDSLNTLPQGVGLETNGLPAAYLEIKKKQVEDLADALGIKPDNPNIVAHIPSSSGANALPDTHKIPLLQEIPNSLHGSEVVRTFGGITVQHMPKGVIALTPEQAMALGLKAPPKEHDAPPPPPGLEQAYNSWVIIPNNHVLGHIANLPSVDIRRYTYEVYQLVLPDNTPIPFVLVDLWTMTRYHKATVETVLAIDRDRTSIPEIYIELVPLRGKSWLEACQAGRHDERGVVSFTLFVKYTMFPRDFRENAAVVASLSDGFPKLSLEMRLKSTDIGYKVPGGKGGEEGEKERGQKKRQEEDVQPMEQE